MQALLINPPPAAPVLGALFHTYRVFMRVRRPPACSALSYVWGHPERVCDIVINGKMAKITKSVADALQSIRKTTRIRAVWADAICTYSDRTAIKYLRILRFTMVRLIWYCRYALLILQYIYVPHLLVPAEGCGAT